MFNTASNIAGNIASVLLGVDAFISRNFRTCCWKLAQCGWVRNTVASNIAGNIARCGCPFRVHFKENVSHNKQYHIRYFVQPKERNILKGYFKEER